MATAEQLRSDRAEDEIFDWRLSELLRAGYEHDDAIRLAGEKDVDLRLAERLLAQGCPHRTALRILL
jgi:hypothetical protein